jgi:transcription elongation factor Elf1
MKATTVTKLFIVCPYCESQETSVGHLEVGRSFGPWFCDKCGNAYRGTRTEDGAVLRDFLRGTRLPIYLGAD